MYFMLCLQSQTIVLLELKIKEDNLNASESNIKVLLLIAATDITVMGGEVFLSVVHLQNRINMIPFDKSIFGGAISLVYFL